MFPEYADYDLSFLAGHAFIIPQDHLRAHERGLVPGSLPSAAGKGDILKDLNAYDSEVFADCFENVQLRLDRLFTLKDKWTLRELQHFLGDFVEPQFSAKFDLWLQKFTRSSKEKNPFNPSQMIQVHIKKF